MTRFKIYENYNKIKYKVQTAQRIKLKYILRAYLMKIIIDLKLLKTLVDLKYLLKNK
jgi:hypothetical protein